VKKSDENIDRMVIEPGYATEAPAPGPSTVTAETKAKDLAAMLGRLCGTWRMI
jgi:hypothetical protein